MDTQNTTGEGSSSAAPLKAGRKRRSFLARLFRGLAIVVPVVAIATWLLGSVIVSRVIDWQLKSQLASRANAKLETASVRYLFPYGVRIEKAHLVVPDTAEGRGWGIDVGRVELTLAKLPLGTGPLVIQSLDIDQPVVRLSAADNVTAKPAAPTAAPQPTAPSGPQKKLSDLFRLSSVTVNDARVEFDPGTHEQNKPPIIWEHLNAKVQTTPLAVGDYQFHFQAKDEPLAVIDADGAFDIDSLLLDMQKLAVSVQVDPAVQSQQLPPAVQEIFRQFKVGGVAKFEAAAKVPLDNPMHGEYAATVSLANGTGMVPGLDQPISPAQFTMRCSNLPNATRAVFDAPLPTELSTKPQPVRLWVAGLKVCSDKRLLQIDDGEIQFDPLTGIWSVGGLKGQIDAGEGPKPIVSLDSNGSIDFNTLVLDVKKFGLGVQCKMQPVVPAQTASTGSIDVLSKLNIGGRMTVDTIARIPLRDARRGLFRTRVAIEDGNATIAGLDGPVSPAACDLVCSNLPGADENSLPSEITGDLPNQFAPVRLWVHKLDVGALKRRVQLDKGELAFDLASGIWSIQQLTGEVDTGTGPRPISELNANGSIDLTDDILDVRKLSVTLQADPTPAMLRTAAADPVTVKPVVMTTTALAATTSPSTNPSTPATQPVQKPMNFAGKVKLDMVAKMPLKDAMCGLFCARFSLTDGMAEVPGVQGSISPVECQMVCTNLPDYNHTELPAKITTPLPPQPAPLRMWVDKLKAVNGNQIVDLDAADGTFDPGTLAWTLDHMTGLIRAGNSAGLLQDANVKLNVPFTLAGGGKLVIGTPIPLDEKSQMTLKFNDALMDVTENEIPFRHISGIVEFHPQEMIVREVNGTSMGGKFLADVKTTWRKVGNAQKIIPSYSGSVKIVDLDLHKVMTVFSTDESLRARTTGQLDFALQYHGLIVPGAPANSPESVVNLAQGAGDFEIRNGFFATIPVLRDVAMSMQNFDAATVGQAAATFTFAKQIVTFQQAAASAPACGVQGAGTVRFDQIADMTFVATPLADWGADVNAIGNPALNKVADWFHKAQDKVNQVQAKVLYQIKVTGPITSPKVDKVIAPDEGPKIGEFFQKMSDNGSDLLQKIKSN